MILPGKHLPQDRSLSGIGGEILSLLDEERGVSEVWERFQIQRREASSPITFDWFVLALGFLFSIGAIELSNSVISVRASK